MVRGESAVIRRTSRATADCVDTAIACWASVEPAGVEFGQGSETHVRFVFRARLAGYEDAPDRLGLEDAQAFPTHCVSTAGLWRSHRPLDRMDWTRFRGHLISREGGVHDVEKERAIFAGVSAEDGREGAGCTQYRPIWDHPMCFAATATPVASLDTPSTGQPFSQSDRASSRHNPEERTRVRPKKTYIYDTAYVFCLKSRDQGPLPYHLATPHPTASVRCRTAATTVHPRPPDARRRSAPGAALAAWTRAPSARSPRSRHRARRGSPRRAGS
jgi:hypothetical protein